MSNSNNTSDNPNDQSSANPTANSMAENGQPFVSSRNGDVPIFGQRSRTATDQYSHPYQLRTIRRSAIDRVNRRKKYKINLKMSRRVLSLSNEARKTLISALADALRTEYGSFPTATSHRTEDDQISYNIEVNRSQYDELSLYSRSTDYTVNNSTSNNNNIGSINHDMEVNDSDNDSENEPPRRGSFIFNVFSNLFNRSQPSEDHE